jgi:pantoate--beta-alanine ligase
VESLGSTAQLRERIRHWRERGERIALVPTMGNLHAGHLKLVRHGCAIADRVVVSLFVNPMQFGPDEDFATYPRTLAADTAALMEVDADLLFVPDAREIRADDLEKTTRVEVPGLSTILCGAFRPVFFTGVATVVTRLFNMVQPDIAIFGEKDYQQLVLIRRMVDELCFPVTVEAVATVREADGLALSSRNQYLNATQRATAPRLYRILRGVRARVAAGARDYPGLEAGAMAELAAAGFRPDYVSIRRADDLAEPAPQDRRLRLLAAAWLGTARLIDNVGISIS